MAKKESLGKDPLDWMNPTKEAKPDKQCKQSKQDNLSKTSKTKPTGVTTKTSKANLPSEWTRATFIMKESNLEKLKNIAYTERKNITTLLNEISERYLNSYKGEILKRSKK